MNKNQNPQFSAIIEAGINIAQFGNGDFIAKVEKMENEHAALMAVAEDAENALNELQHWHQWRCHTSPDYADSDGYRICQGRIERSRASLANLAAIREGKAGK